jgi:DNA-directed RNA polymerase subunit M/transcription elongation factor TFIIS
MDAEQIADQEAIAPVAVVNSTLQEQRRVHRPCSQCGNPEAFSWLSQIDGEHAGVKQERTLKRFQCTRCFQTWTESL